MSKRLLILTDDEPVTTRALALDLTDAGYRVETAVDRDEAIRRSRAVPIDLLIATEPRGGEPGFVERFRRIRPAAKVVLMTTRHPQKGFELDETGARVGKPFDLDDIRSLVERLLDRGDDATRSAK
jgi:DNA-binding response OmpR family regulator